MTNNMNEDNNTWEIDCTDVMNALSDSLPKSRSMPPQSSLTNDNESTFAENTSPKSMEDDNC